MGLASSVEWVEAIGTVFGAVATAAAVIIALTARRVRLKVRCSRPALLWADIEQPGIAVTATNAGSRTVKVTMIGLLRQDATLMITPTPHPVSGELPALLSEGEAIDWFVPDHLDQLGTVSQQLDSVMAALVTDSAGKSHYGRGPDCGRGPLWWHVRRARRRARRGAKNKPQRLAKLRSALNIRAWFEGDSPGS